MSATGRASEIGTEHGTAAAEAWWAERAIPLGWADPIRDDGLLGIDRELLPTPDLSDGLTISGLALKVWPTRGPKNSEELRSVVDAYSAAFTAAVEATVRAKCEATR